jgi:uncharacterized protein YbjT (DUF2867 family)
MPTTSDGRRSSRFSRSSWIDTRGIAAVAAAALTGTGHEGRIYELTGPATFSHAEVAEKLSTLPDRKVAYVAVPDVAAYQAMIGMGMDPWYAYGTVVLNQQVRRGLADVTTGTIELVAGKPPRALDAFLQEYLPAFK